MVPMRGQDRLDAFLLYVLRNRLTDPFGDGNIPGVLPPSLFPPDGCFMQVFDLWVDPELRRTGVGRTLKRMLEAVAAARHVGMIYTVTESDHTAVLGLNLELGYVEIYRGPMWDRVERVSLAKYLR